MNEGFDARPQSNNSHFNSINPATDTVPATLTPN